MFDRLTIAQVGNDTQITGSGLSIARPGVNASTINSSDFASI